MNQQAKPVRQPASPLALAKRIFDLNAADERRALDWICRFHRPRGIYSLLRTRRSRDPDGNLLVFMLTRCQAKRPDARPEWMMIEYKATIETISVRWRSCSTLAAARTMFTIVRH